MFRIPNITSFMRSIPTPQPQQPTLSSPVQQRTIVDGYEIAERSALQSLISGKSHAPRLKTPTVQFLTPRLDDDSRVPTHHRTPAQTAEALFQYVIENDPDPRGLYSLLIEAKDLGAVRELQCAYKSPAMNEVVRDKATYNTIDDFFGALKARQDRIISCLNVFQKLKWGPKIQSLLERFTSRDHLLEGTATIYGSNQHVTGGNAAADLFSYFFRPDTLTENQMLIFDTFMSKLQQTARANSWV